MPSNLSATSSLPANLSDTDFWSSAKKFTANPLEPIRDSWVADFFEMEMRISGGSSETLVKELTVMPLGTDPKVVVTTVTPWGKLRITSFNPSCATLLADKILLRFRRHS